MYNAGWSEKNEPTNSISIHENIVKFSTSYVGGVKSKYAVVIFKDRNTTQMRRHTKS